MIGRIDLGNFEGGSTGMYIMMAEVERVIDKDIKETVYD